ncbi:hypothetical protein [Azospirillum sp. sgz301742]
MPDDRPRMPSDGPNDYPLGIEPEELIAMLMEGLADLEAGRVVSMEEADRMVDEALAQQRAEQARKR